MAWLQGDVGQVIRAFILAATIATLLCMWVDRPRPVHAVEVKYCAQPVWNRWGIKIGEMFVLCSDLDRYEEA